MINQIRTDNEPLNTKFEPSVKKSFKELYLEYNKSHSKIGYFVIGWELINRLYLSLESYGYIIPNMDTKNKHRIRPDKSIQPAFMDFMKNRYIDLSEVFENGQIIDNDDRMEFRVKHFKSKYLPDFIEFFEDDWLVNTAVNYFKTRDKLALTYLPYLLSDPIFLEIDNEKPKVNTIKTMSEHELAEECRRTVRQYQLKRLASI